MPVRVRQAATHLELALQRSEHRIPGAVSGLQALPPPRLLGCFKLLGCKRFDEPGEVWVEY